MEGSKAMSHQMGRCALCKGFRKIPETKFMLCSDCVEEIVKRSKDRDKLAKDDKKKAKAK